MLKTETSFVHTVFRYRLDVHPHHTRRLKALAGASRYVWNHFLRFREDAYLAARAAGGALMPARSVTGASRAN